MASKLKFENGTHNHPSLSTQVEVVVLGITDNVVNNGSCRQQIVN